MSVKKNPTIKKVISLEEKKKEILIEEQKAKNQRLKTFVEKHNALCKEFNCGFVAQAIISGSKVSTRLVPVANE